MVKGIILHGKDGYNNSMKLRREVFIDEQKLSSVFLKDEYDNEAYHVLIYEDDKIVGIGRLIEYNNYTLIGRIAVSKNKRGNQYGDLIVRMLVDKSLRLSDKPVLVKSQLYAVNFYKKLGFNVISDTYMNEGISVVDLEINKGELKMKCNNKKVN